MENYAYICSTKHNHMAANLIKLTNDTSNALKSALFTANTTAHKIDQDGTELLWTGSKRATLAAIKKAAARFAGNPDFIYIKNKAMQFGNATATFDL